MKKRLREIHKAKKSRRVLERIVRYAYKKGLKKGKLLAEQKFHAELSSVMAKTLALNPSDRKIAVVLDEIKSIKNIYGE